MLDIFLMCFLKSQIGVQYNFKLLKVLYQLQFFIVEKYIHLLCLENIIQMVFVVLSMRYEVFYQCCNLINAFVSLVAIDGLFLQCIKNNCIIRVHRNVKIRANFREVINIQ